MAWIESHQSLANHPKLLKLSSLTGYDLDRCIAKLHRLWWWALDYAEDGDLSRFTAEEIGLGIQIFDPNEAKKFYDGLVGSQFIDRETLFIHHWLDYAGRYLKSKYHTNNPLKYEKILKKYAGKPKGKPEGKPRGDLPTYQPNPPNQPNLPKDTSQTGEDPRIRGADAKQLFDRFWAAYPKHKARAEAEKAFLTIHPDERLLARMISSIERAKMSDDWKKQNGRYIPHADKWLEGRRWEDEFDGGESGGGKGSKYAGIGVTVETGG